MSPQRGTAGTLFTHHTAHFTTQNPNPNAAIPLATLRALPPASSRCSCGVNEVCSHLRGVLPALPQPWHTDASLRVGDGFFSLSTSLPFPGPGSGISTSPALPILSASTLNGRTPSSTDGVSWQEQSCSHQHHIQPAPSPTAHPGQSLHPKHTGTGTSVG